MARKKAEEMGVRHDELRTRVVDGKTVWVTKSDLNVELEKQRKIAATNKIIRSIRDGDKSLFALITQEIHNARALCTTLVELKALHTMQSRDHHISIETVEKRSISTASQINELEAQIDQQKSKNKLFGQATEILDQISKARASGEDEKVAQMMSTYRPVLQAYQKQVSALEPAIQSCRTFRVDLQKLYLKISDKVWELRNRVLQIWHGWINDIAPYISEDDRSHYEGDKRWIEYSQFKLNQEMQDLVRKTPGDGDVNQELLKQWDEVSHHLKGLLVQQQQFMKEMSAFVEIYVGKQEETDTNKNRMAFAQRRRS